MVRPDEVCDTVALALENSGNLPNISTYLTIRADESAEHADVDLPYAEVMPVDVARARTRNTDFVGYAKDDNGNNIGKIFYALFEMRVQIDVWTLRRGSYNPYAMGGRVRRALYKYDSHQVGDPFEDANGNSINSISYFALDGGERNDDLTPTQPLGRWTQEAFVHFNEVINTADEYDVADVITNVRISDDGSAVDATGDEAIRLEPSFDLTL